MPPTRAIRAPGIPGGHASVFYWSNSTLQQLVQRHDAKPKTLKDGDCHDAAFWQRVSVLLTYTGAPPRKPAARLPITKRSDRS